MRPRKPIELGKYVVSDPEICHGQLTFKGTRIMVKSVLEMLAEGHSWDQISTGYYGKITHEAIAEAIKLACESLTEKTGKRRLAA
jgi:uncharacterized protein (DUF433 family)